jgi:hypothetical protein
VVVSQADKLINTRTVELFSRFAALVTSLCQSGDNAIVAQIPAVLSENPGVFLNIEMDITPLVAVFAASKNPNVRRGFLDSFLLLFARTPGHAGQETLLQAFRCLFDHPDASLKSRLTCPHIYSFFGPGKLVPLIPMLADFAASLKSWRDIAQMSQSFLSFPADVLRQSWKLITNVMMPLFLKNPNSLAQPLQAFFARITGILDPDSCEEFLKRTLSAISRHPTWSVRRLTAPTIVALSLNLQPAALAALHAHIRPLLADPVPAVVASVLPPLAVLRQMYNQKGEEAGEKDALAMLMSARQAFDPLLTEVWGDAWAQCNAKLEVSSLPKLPISRPRSLRRAESKGASPSPVRAVATLPAQSRRGSVVPQGLTRPRRRTLLGPNPPTFAMPSRPGSGDGHS